MLIECKRHGAGPGIQVSPDLSLLTKSDVLVPELYEIIYTYDEEVYIRCLLSASFAAKHGIGGGGTFVLPDEYPMWHSELTIVCEKCWDTAVEV